MSQTLQQTGLFDDEHADIGALFDHLDQIPSVELEKRWAIAIGGGNRGNASGAIAPKFCRR